MISRSCTKLCVNSKAYVNRADGETVELRAVSCDVEDVEVIGEIIDGSGEALSPRLRALDEDNRSAFRGEGLNALIEERGDHYEMSV